MGTVVSTTYALFEPGRTIIADAAIV